ncbi:hypothetical protein ACIQB5_46470 [Streptomyces sp. NPDC088560]|uniref:hypothetical protein n=1 Tax=Streptomyces sp. NPDC088560 TaxID=3365868 RepID=UPI003804652D
MTDPNVVSGTVVPGARVEVSNAGGCFARLRAFAVTLGLGPIFVVVLSLVLQRSAWPASVCVAFAAVAAASARTSRLGFVWARLD